MTHQGYGRHYSMGRKKRHHWPNAGPARISIRTASPGEQHQPGQDAGPVANSRSSTSKQRKKHPDISRRKQANTTQCRKKREAERHHAPTRTTQTKMDPTAAGNSAHEQTKRKQNLTRRTYRYNQEQLPATNKKKTWRNQALSDTNKRNKATEDARRNKNTAPKPPRRQSKTEDHQTKTTPGAMQTKGNTSHETWPPKT